MRTFFGVGLSGADAFGYVAAVLVAAAFVVSLVVSAARRSEEPTHGIQVDTRAQEAASDRR